ncbi:MAG TPA: hypothetical protein VLF79_01700 [Candidatus Saccharimonadales bacterium]|nr:hypothetical protein [Candidatus Saccharimonadales bacterium]
MPKSPQIPGQEQLFDPNEGKKPDFSGHVPYKSPENSLHQFVDQGEAERALDRLDDQGQTNPSTALGRLGIAREVEGGEIYRSSPVQRSPKPQLSRPQKRSAYSRTRRGKQAADQLPEDERHDPYS